MWNKSINNKTDKMIRFNLPELWLVVEGKNIDDAIEKGKKIISKK